MDIGGGEEVRKYPHMCSSSLGAKGGGAVIRNGGEEGGGEKRECTLCLYSFVQKKILYFVHFNSGNVRCVCKSVRSGEISSHVVMLYVGGGGRKRGRRCISHTYPHTHTHTHPHT